MASTYSFTNLSVTTALTATPLVQPTAVENWQPDTATSGTDVANATTVQHVTSLYIPCTMTITNVNYLIGSVGGTDKCYAVIYDNAGNVLGNSTVVASGTTVGTAATIQTLALTAPIVVNGPTNIFVGISANGATSKFRAIPAYTNGGTIGGSVTVTQGTVAAITVPTTFTADLAPIVYVN